MKRRRGRSLLGLLLRAGLAALALLAAAEAALRATGWRPVPGWLLLDHAVGRTLLPGARVRAWGATVHVGADGLRTAPPGTAASAAEAPAVLFLGGSCTFGYGLPWDETYPARFGELLAARGTKVRVVNGGVPLGDSSNRLAFLRARGDAIRPRLVVFSEAVNELAAVQGGTHQCHASGTLVNHSTSAGEETWPVEAGGPAAAPPSPLRAADYARSLYGHAGWQVFAQTAPALRSLARSSPPFTWLYRRDPERWRRGLKVSAAAFPHGRALFESNLREMTAWCRARGIAMAFVEQPRQGHADFLALLDREVRERTREGVTAFLDGRDEDAVRALAEAVRGGERYLMPRYDLAVALLRAGSTADAAPHLRVAEEHTTTAHNALMSEVAYKDGVPIAHAELVFQTRRGLFLGDGMHPNGEGNRLIAAELVKTLDAAGIDLRAPRQR